MFTGRRMSSPSRSTLLACLAGLALTGAALAQNGTIAATPASTASAPPGTPAAGTRPEPKELLELFIHYTLIDNRGLAASFGQELIDRGLSNADFVALVESSNPERFEQALGRAVKAPELQNVVAPLSRAFDQGKIERSRDAAEIQKNIAMLTGPLRGKLIAQQRLKAAGEYAMPQLLEALLNPGNPILQEEVNRLVIEMGRQAVMPLAAALAKAQPAQQAMIADVLGSIGNRSALPFLADLAGASQNSDASASANRAIERLGGTNGASVADLYAQLAEAYYAERPELTNFPGEGNQLLWDFDSGGRLSMTPVATPVFNEAVTMRLSERALELAPESSGTLSLWVASNLRREIQTPEGYVNPAYPTTTAALPGATPRRDATYFAVAAGAPICQQVLGRALDSSDAVLARRAIAAVQQTAGGNGLWGSSDGSMPLLRALTYPNRRVQYDAALALAAAQPQSGFAGSERVVPTLAGAVRDSGSAVAAIITREAEIYQPLRKLLEGQGFRVLPQGRALGDLAAPIAEAPSVDLIIVQQGSGEAIPAHLEAIRADNRTLATPVFVLTGPEAAVTLSRRYEGNAMVMVRQSAISEEAMGNAIRQLLHQASGGPISTEEAGQYATRALGALRELAISNNQFLRVEDAAMPLMGILGSTNAPSDMRLRAADIVARIGQDRAQRAVMDAALAATDGNERLALLALSADSAKRFGNRLEQRQVNRVVELASSQSDAEATAAAALMGALNLPNSQLLPLILKKS